MNKYTLLKAAVRIIAVLSVLCIAVYAVFQLSVIINGSEKTPSFLGRQFLPVNDQTMEPSLAENSLVFINKQDDYSVNEVVAVKTEQAAAAAGQNNSFGDYAVGYISEINENIYTVKYLNDENGFEFLMQSNMIVGKCGYTVGGLGGLFMFSVGKYSILYMLFLPLFLLFLGMYLIKFLNECEYRAEMGDYQSGENNFISDSLKNKKLLNDLAISKNINGEEDEKNSVIKIRRKKMPFELSENSVDLSDNKTPEKENASAQINLKKETALKKDSDPITGQIKYGADKYGDPDYSNDVSDNYNANSQSNVNYESNNDEHPIHPLFASIIKNADEQLKEANMLFNTPKDQGNSLSSNNSGSSSDSFNDTNSEKTASKELFSADKNTAETKAETAKSGYLNKSNKNKKEEDKKIYTSTDIDDDFKILQAKIESIIRENNKRYSKQAEYQKESQMKYRLEMDDIEQTKEFIIQKPSAD